MQITILQAILLGLFCFLVSTGMFPLGWLSMNIMSKPLIHCMIIGLIMGDMKNALIISVKCRSAGSRPCPVSTSRSGLRCR